MASDPSNSANPPNAQRGATGPHDTTVTSQNATKHGILSERIFLKDEDPNEFYTLSMQLKHDLQPVGLLETFIVDRMAVTMWRILRLIRAEAAQIELERQVGSEAMREQAGRVVKKEKNYLSQDDFRPLTAVEQKDLDAYQALFDEYRQNKDQLSHYGETDLPALQQAMPLLYALLESHAQEESKSIADYLRARGSAVGHGFQAALKEWGEEVIKVVRTKIAELLPRQQLSCVLDLLRISLSTPEKFELFSRYQTALDNELYKARKELERAQDWRRKTLEAELPAETEPHQHAIDEGTS